MFFSSLSVGVQCLVWGCCIPPERIEFYICQVPGSPLSTWNHFTLISWFGFFPPFFFFPLHYASNVNPSHKSEWILICGYNSQDLSASIRTPNGNKRVYLQAPLQGGIFPCPPKGVALWADPGFIGYWGDSVSPPHLPCPVPISCPPAGLQILVGGVATSVFSIPRISLILDSAICWKGCFKNSLSCILGIRQLDCFLYLFIILAEMSLHHLFSAIW